MADVNSSDPRTWLVADVEIKLLVEVDRLQSKPGHPASPTLASDPQHMAARALRAPSIQYTVTY